MGLKFKFRFCNTFGVLELKDLPTKFINTNSMVTALVTNKKWPFQFPWSWTLGVHPPLGMGVLVSVCAIVESPLPGGLDTSGQRVYR